MSSSSGWRRVKRGRDNYNRYPATQSYYNESWYRARGDQGQAEDEAEALWREFEDDVEMEGEVPPGEYVQPARYAYGQRYEVMPLGYGENSMRVLVRRPVFGGEQDRAQIRFTKRALAHKVAPGKNFG